jgi:GNAT superfamily N-acetyltransferase
MAATIRRIRPADWRALRELRLRSLRDAPEAFGQTHENALGEPDSEWQSAARASANGDRRAWFIASVDREDVGLVQARRRLPDECLVFSMWVAPSTRYTGVGKLLIDAVADWALGWGARRIVLWVFGANEGAQRFYARIGFSFLRDGEDAESGRSYGALAMERLIGGESSEVR